VTVRRSRNDIMNMRIADGIKEILSKYRFTRNKILTYSASELASVLNVDEYIAILILNAARADYATNEAQVV
jgi:hypothetical protein